MEGVLVQPPSTYLIIGFWHYIHCLFFPFLFHIGETIETTHFDKLILTFTKHMTTISTTPNSLTLTKTEVQLEIMWAKMVGTITPSIFTIYSIIFMNPVLKMKKKMFKETLLVILKS